MDHQLADTPVRPQIDTKRIPSGPRNRLVIGNLPELSGDQLEFAMNLSRTYGDVAVFHLGPIKINMVFHPDGVKRVLQDNNHNYTKDSPVFHAMRPLLGNGLVVSEGDFWLRQRRIMQPMFHRQRINGFAEAMTAAALKTVESWQPAAQTGQPLDISREMMRLALDIACQTLFSMDVSSEAAEIGKAVDVLIEDFTFRFQHPIYPPLRVPVPRNRRFLRAIATLDRIVYGMIAHRREEQHRPNDLLSLLIDARDEETGEGMTDRQIRDELTTLLIAGHETTANTLTWALCLLSGHPDVQRRLCGEVDSVLEGRTPTAADLAKLPYTQMVIDETLRLYPPAWVTNRYVVEDDVICGYKIEKGSTVSVSPYVTHRLPQFWENPEGFDPLRFTAEAVKDRPHFAYFPFGGGPRMCIGRGFALMEAPLVLATLLQHARLDLLPGREVRRLALTTLRPMDGLPMLVKMV